MKRLFIVRHAKSSWDFPELDDSARPLNKRGKRNAPEMGQRLANRKVVPESIISSPAKRASDTAKLIAKEISFESHKIQNEPMFYLASVKNMVAVLQAVPNDVETLMVFGHNPGLTDLANFLSGADIYNIPTCGIAEIEFSISSWKEVEINTGDLKSFDYPKKI